MTASTPGPWLHLLTDLYQLTMMCAYVATGKADEQAVFRSYFRRLPFGGGFALAAGLNEVVEQVGMLTGFPGAQIDYLRGLPTFARAPGRFWERLRDYRFEGTIEGVPEGTAVFPEVPLCEVRGGLFECQLLETLLLCTIGFPTLVATEAAHCGLAAQGRPVYEFGLRRAQGPEAGMRASRAAYLGGCAGTSNVAAGMRYGIPLAGTHAHSFVQAFDSELEAFRAYAAVFPDQATLLVDTVDTVRSGMPHAVAVGRDLAAEGHRLNGVRLDSGDLAVLARAARQALNAAGLDDARVLASNDLDPPTIASLIHQGAPIDSFGVGTRLATAFREPALGCVYKLVELEGTPKIKLSANPTKRTIPGRQVAWRLMDRAGRFVADFLLPPGQEPAPPRVIVIDPHNPSIRTPVTFSRSQPLAETVLAGGAARPPATLEAARQRARDQLAGLPPGCLRLTNPHIYPVGVSPATWRQMERALEAMLEQADRPGTEEEILDL